MKHTAFLYLDDFMEEEYSDYEKLEFIRDLIKDIKNGRTEEILADLKEHEYKYIESCEENRICPMCGGEIVERRISAGSYYNPPEYTNKCENCGEEY